MWLIGLGLHVLIGAGPRCVLDPSLAPLPTCTSRSGWVTRLQTWDLEGIGRVYGITRPGTQQLEFKFGLGCDLERQVDTQLVNRCGQTSLKNMFSDNFSLTVKF